MITLAPTKPRAQTVEESFRFNQLQGAKLTLTGAPTGYDVTNLLRAERDSPLVAPAGVTNLTLVAEFQQPRTFNNLLIEEFLVPGQRVSAFSLDVWEAGNWQLLAEGRTIGHKRIVPFAKTTTTKVRFRITAARDHPALRFIGLYEAQPYGTNDATVAKGEFLPALPEPKRLRPGLRWAFYEDDYDGATPYRVLSEDLDSRNVEPRAIGVDADPLPLPGTISRAHNRRRHFAMRFDGYVRAPVRGVYTFHAGANAGCRLFVDGRALITNDEGGQRANPKKGDIPLQPGLHRVSVLYYYGSDWSDHAGEPRLVLGAEWPGNAGGDEFMMMGYQRLRPLLCGEE